MYTSGDKTVPIRVDPTEKRNKYETIKLPPLEVYPFTFSSHLCTGLSVANSRATLVLGQLWLNFNGSNTDGSFTMALSNSFLSPLEKSHSCRFGIISGVFLFHIEKWNIVCTH